MKIAITLVHNKTDAQNEAQITALASLITPVTDGPFTNPDTGETWTSIHYEISALNIPHELKVYQIVPFGVKIPSNINAINSHNVFYGVGDEDKIGSHPRFFNWALKRGTDNGADISVYIEDITKLTGTKARQALQKFTNDVEFVETDFGKLASLRLLKTVGQLKEDRTLINAITDLKTRVVEKGLKNG